MKKALLLLAAGAFGFSAQAQLVAPSIVAKQVKTPIQEPINVSNFFQTKNAATQAANKTTTGGTRWYIPFEMYDFLLLGQQLQVNLSAAPIWFDSTVLQVYSSGPGQINYTSVAQVVDPISNVQLFNDPNSYPGEIKISSTDPYTVDSVTIVGVYQRKPNKPNVVDTLIMSLGTNSFTYYWNKNTSTFASPYLPSNKDTLWGVAPTDIDSVNRAIFSDDASAPRVYWKVPLTASMGNDTLNIQQFSFEVPNGGYNVPAGRKVAVSYTFKSGDTWTPNVDTFSNLNNFRAIFGEATPNSQMPYYYYSAGDRNGSSLMFSTDTSWYLPSVVIEAVNTTAFSYEFLYAGIHASCPTCYLTSVGDVTNNITAVNAYPNPANTSVEVSFSVKNNESATVNLMNTVGQVLKSVKTNNGKATFSTSNLASGIYFYTVEANGQKITNRVVVSH